MTLEKWHKLEVTPKPAPRLNRLDGLKKTPKAARYFAYKDELRAAAYNARYELGESIRAIFVLPVPKSWSKKKRAEMIGQVIPHQQTPDSDNLMKALKDTLALSDAYVWDERATKVWGEEGAIYIKNLDPKRILWEVTNDVRCNIR
jgi:Holliday junction resolvase RusA-like endonuclease